MSAPVASKNLYELLGNDHDEDSDKEPEPPVKVADKSIPRTSKRNAPDIPPSAARAGTGGERGGRGGRRGGFSGNDGAFRDNTAGSANNRGKSTDENYSRGDREGGRSRGRGRGRGEGRGRGGPGREDRHSRQAQTDSEKQVSQGWGSTKGESEWTDEQAGEAIAKAEEKEGFDTNPDAPVDADGEHLASTKENDAPAAEPEPEDNTMSYSDYLAKVAAEKLDLGAPAARKPNEGKTDKKWAAAKPLQKEEEDTYIAGAGSKAKRERQRKEKTTLDIDQRYVEPPQGGRGGREGGRGGARGRGGDRDRGGERGRGAGRGRGDGFRGPRRGGPGASAGAVDVADKSAFPSLGGSGSS